jgi:hypothetical protein
MTSVDRTAVERLIGDKFKGQLPVLPPQYSKYGVGDILVLKNRLNPVSGNINGDWFDPQGRKVTSPFEVPPAGTNVGGLTFDSNSNQALNGIFTSTVFNAVDAKAGVEKTETQTYRFSAANIKETSGAEQLEAILLDINIMSKLLQGERCQNSYMKNGKAVICIVVADVSGDMATTERQQGGKKSFGGGKVDASFPQVAARAVLTVDATNSSEHTVQNDSTNSTNRSVFAVRVNFFKVAHIDGEFFSKGPVDCQGIDCNATREAASWLQVGDLKKTRFLGLLGEETRKGLEGMHTMANYIAAPPDPSLTWNGNLNVAAKALSEIVGTDGAVDPKNASAAFTVSNEKGKANYERACDKMDNLVNKFIVELEDVKEDTNAANVQRRKGGYHGSVIVILGYDEDTLSKLFNELKNGEMDLGDGWHLKGMRVALEFDMEDAGLLPVRFADGTIHSDQTPTKVLRYLDHGALLLTPVEGLPEKDCKKMGKIFGNGDCEDWEMVELVKFVDTQALISQLEDQGYTEVKRSADDIDYKHLLGQTKMARDVLSPPMAQAGAPIPGSVQPAMVAPEEAVGASIPGSVQPAMVAPEEAVGAPIPGSVQPAMVASEQHGGIQSPGDKKLAAVSPVRAVKTKKRKLSGGSKSPVQQD